jgi:hypothetical protein
MGVERSLKKPNEMKRYVFLVAAIVTLQGLYGQNQAGTQLSAFAGKYQFTVIKINFLQISVKDSGLLLKQLWDNQEIAFKRTGALAFYNDEHSFPLVFNKDNLGKITQVLAFSFRLPDRRSRTHRRRGSSLSW